MIYDPKTVRGDIIASIKARSTNFEGLCKRFDNGTNGLLQIAIMGTVNQLCRERLLRETSKGYLYCTDYGFKYITDLGYYE